MESNQNYESLLNEAKIMYALGYDNTYIEFQFAEQEVDDVTIDKIVADINILRKVNRKNKGIKLIVWGASFIIGALLITFLISRTQFPKDFVMHWAYVMCLLAIGGVSTIVKGLIDILGI